MGLDYAVGYPAWTESRCSKCTRTFNWVFIWANGSYFNHLNHIPGFYWVCKTKLIFKLWGFWKKSQQSKTVSWAILLKCCMYPQSTLSYSKWGLVHWATVNVKTVNAAIYIKKPWLKFWSILLSRRQFLPQSCCCLIEICNY